MNNQDYGNMPKKRLESLVGYYANKKRLYNSRGATMSTQELKELLSLQTYISKNKPELNDLLTKKA